MKNENSIFSVVTKFATEEACIAHFENIRWPNGLECPKCASKKVFKFVGKGKTDKDRYLYECVDCHYQYSVTTGTIFHNSHIPLRKWFLAIYMICSSKKGISANQLWRDLELGSYKSAWYMAHRIRLGMQEDGQFCQKFSGICEVEETYVGGKGKGPRGRGAANKVPVVGIKERTSGKIRLQAVNNAKATTLATFISKHAEKGAEIHTDEFSAYLWLDSSEFAHRAVNHQRTYVDGNTHTNGVENVWSLFKRGVMGIFHKVSEKYLPLYLNEFEFRFNNRDSENMMDRVLETCL